MGKSKQQRLREYEPLNRIFREAAEKINKLTQPPSSLTEKVDNELNLADDQTNEQ